MTKRVDILADLYFGRISPDEAFEIYDETRAAGEIGLGEGLGMSKMEWAASAQGVPFEVIAKWRYEGWPNICPVCQQIIQIKKFGWLAKRRGGGYRLVHIGCLDEYRARFRRSRQRESKQE